LGFGDADGRWVTGTGGDAELLGGGGSSFECVDRQVVAGRAVERELVGGEAVGEAGDGGFEGGELLVELLDGRDDRAEEAVEI